MIIKVSFTPSIKRSTVIRTGYRPDWISEKKPTINCARLTFEDVLEVNPGTTHICYLEPLVPDYWKNLGLYDTLKCMEGSNEVGEAVILEIT